MRWTCLLILLWYAPVGCGASGGSAGAEKTDPADDWFEDATEKLDVNFTHVDGANGKYFMPALTSGGVALLDYDNDGRWDIYLLQNGGPKSAHKNQLYHQTESGTFENVSAGSGLDINGYCQGVAALAWVRRLKLIKSKSFGPRARKNGSQAEA